jgi:putative peptidoglycan lipid II flippase
MQKRIIPPAGERIASISQTRPARLLTMAAALHLLLAVIIFVAGRFALLPNMFNAHGMGIFATDSYVYRLEAMALAKILTREGLAAWLNTPSPFHVKFYSLSMAVFGPLLGFNNLSVEPLNVLYYLAILILVFKLGQEVFDRRVALVSAVIVALWPSFLLHTTQLLRDPLFIVALLVLVLVYAKWLKKDYSWRRGLGMGAVAGMSVAVLWANRSNMWELMLAIVLLGAGLFVVRQICERRLLKGNLVGLVLLLALTITIPQIVPESPKNIEPSLVKSLVEVEDPSLLAEPEEEEESVATVEQKPATMWASLWARVIDKRAGFVRLYPNAGSNIDADVQFNSIEDAIRYVPRALVVGLFAPFPSMWFRAGDLVGVQGRLLSGAETLMMYLIELLALFGLWQSRRRFYVWLLVLVALLGMTALGLVVLNIATLYRMRYIFWILLIIVGAAGAVQILPTLFSRKEEKAQTVPLA